MKLTVKLELKLKLKLYILLGCSVEGTADVGSTIAVEVEGQAEAAMAPGVVACSSALGFVAFPGR
jgi:hypothetical protein